MLNPSLLKELKEALEQEHDKLVSELKSVAKPGKIEGRWSVKFPAFEEGETSSHVQNEEEADEVEEYEMLLAAEQSLESRLLEVNKALGCMQKSGYGTCKKCGKEISIERLKANPAAEFHVEHSA